MLPGERDAASCKSRPNPLRYREEESRLAVVAGDFSRSAHGKKARQPLPELSNEKGHLK
jgi:hypothetical protein